MSVKVTIDMFSGRPNPEIELSAAESKEFLKTISATGAMRKVSEKTPEEPAHLGFRGIKVEQVKNATKELPDEFYLSHETMYSDGKAAALKDTGTMERIEQFIVSRGKMTTNGGSAREIMSLYRESLKASFDIRQRIIEIGPKVIGPLKITCPCGPVYEPDWWNNNPAIKGNNNCYNYACNYRTDTFAQPGKATGNQYTSLSGCAVASGQKSAKDGAISDCLIDTPAADNKCPASGHLVALVIWPGVDFHWYRKGLNTRWSHKPGSTSVTNLDNSGAIIVDPRTANRGNYTQFCTFMNVLHGHIKIK